MADEPTCGQGLATHSTLPAQLGKLMAVEHELSALLEERIREDDAMLTQMRP